MSIFLLLVGIAALVVLGLYYFASATPAQVANTLRLVGPAFLVLVGAIFSFAGRISIGAPLIMLAVAWFGRQRRMGRSRRTGGQKSVVRSAWLEMELDHDSGDMDGVVLVGRFEGRRLFEMSDDELLELAADVKDDRESAELLEAYLDRRIADWRAGFEPDEGAGLGAAPGSGAMTQKEAYEILGLAAGASEAEIREAHRRLMKRMHPDAGGSTFLAGRINEAKTVLLSRHD